ncbi:DUF7344 domain-containing protein [Halobaculum magnesiiphilum]|uniref:DUF7344 domain-containing protein n=1 Tax=Halobaculum magnesiiphilum TaxID=1017351 RepID=A0A8T8WEY6_9EURY|nr:hypothetical protein [Halobaculum magnesiiphilum]QZP38417.1 hypothetical protein K6T50_04560 [Halobaculum magnesiiphilum]
MTTARGETTDDVFALIEDRRRRTVLRYLRNRTGTGDITVGRLAAAVASVEAVEGERGGTEATDREGSVDPAVVDQVSVTLRHVHLPKLADRGVIDYDPDAGTVRFEGFEPGTLESLKRIERVAGELAAPGDSTRASG